MYIIVTIYNFQELNAYFNYTIIKSNANIDLRMEATILFLNEYDYESSNCYLQSQFEYEFPTYILNIWIPIQLWLLEMSKTLG